MVISVGVRGVGGLVGRVPGWMQHPSKMLGVTGLPRLGRRLTVAAPAGARARDNGRPFLHWARPLLTATLCFQSVRAAVAEEEGRGAERLSSLVSMAGYSFLGDRRPQPYLLSHFAIRLRSLPLIDPCRKNEEIFKINAPSLVLNRTLLVRRHHRLSTDPSSCSFLLARKPMGKSGDMDRLGFASPNPMRA